MSSSNYAQGNGDAGQIHARLEQVFRTVFATDDLTITDATTAAEIPEWDSLAHINLMFAIEQEFGVQFSGEDFSELESVGELKQYLAARVAG